MPIYEQMLMQEDAEYELHVSAGDRPGGACSVFAERCQLKLDIVDGRDHVEARSFT